MDQHINSSSLIGNNIRQLRMSKGLTQEQMVSRLQLMGCDISRATFSKIECGIRHISLHELKSIATLLNVDYNTLLGYDNEK